MTATQSLQLHITGLDCVDCARTLEAGVAQLAGVHSASLNFGAFSLEVEYNARQVSSSAIVGRVRELGYDVLAEELTFELEGLDCADCAAKLEDAIGGLPNVLEARVLFGSGQLQVRGVDSDSLRDAVVNQAGQLGYTARLPLRATDLAAEVRRPWWTEVYRRRRTLLTALSGAFLAAPLVLRAAGQGSGGTTAAYALAIVSGGFYVARSGWAALRTTRSLDMNALMSIAAIGAMAIGEWAEGATAVFLFSLGNTLEALTMDRARQAIRKLMDLSPPEATRLHGDHGDRVPVQQLQVGDLIEVKPGERVPMDGTLEAGVSTVNQAPITGESTPVEVSPGSRVFAGSINGEGALVMRVTKLARDNTLARIVQMVQQAQGRRAPAQRIVDTFAKYYTPSVIALAAVVAVVPPLALREPLTVWLYRALVLLVIACPCALVISTPVAIVSAISNGARRGVLVKGGMHLEAVGRVQAVAFDKTGTLTEGRAAVTDIETFDSATAKGAAPGSGQDCLSADSLLALAASLESHSRHPVARAIVEEASRRGLPLLPVTNYQEVSGHGAQAQLNRETYYIGSHPLLCARVPHKEDVCQRVARCEAEGKTCVLLGSTHDVVGLIAIADRVREDSADVVRALRDLGIRQMVLLSGDNERTAQAIGQVAGITRVHANLLPEHKVEAVERLLSESGRVAMVGDGVNDAPALARATVGITMGAAGSDAALETADIVLMSDDLGKIPYVIRLGRRTLQNIRQNIALSLLIKGAFLLLALFGLATLWMAILADMGTSLLVTLNGMRLLHEDGR